MGGAVGTQMNILFWIPPWPSQGDFTFHQNSVRKHLFLQAQTLKAAGFAIDIVLPMIFRRLASEAPSGVNIIELSLSDLFQFVPAID